MTHRGDFGYPELQQYFEKGATVGMRQTPSDQSMSQRKSSVAAAEQQYNVFESTIMNRVLKEQQQADVN